MARISDNPLVPLKQTPENVLTPSVALINNPLDKWKKSLFYIRQEKIFPAKANWFKKKFRRYRGINFRERKNTIVSKKNRFMRSMMLPGHCLRYQLGKKKAKSDKCMKNIHASLYTGMKRWEEESSLVKNSYFVPPWKRSDMISWFLWMANTNTYKKKMVGNVFTFFY